MLRFFIVFLLTIFASTATFAGNEDAKRPSPAAEGSWLQITGHSFQGDRLIINYAIRYPGMTKVKLYNSSNELLWRGQYVDDKEGDHRIVLKASILMPGSYLFEFDYKDQKQSYSISM
jgi:hypothetical protein